MLWQIPLKNQQATMVHSQSKKLERIQFQDGKQFKVPQVYLWPLNTTFMIQVSRDASNVNCLHHQSATDTPALRI